MSQPKYTIISLNDDRLSYKQNIRRNVHLEEWFMPAVDGRAVDLDKEFWERNIQLHPDWTNPKVGELGVWLSNFDRWAKIAQMDTPSVVFEDDAVVPVDFQESFDSFYEQLPDDWDFASLWVPENQRIDYLYNLTYERGIPRIESGLRHPDDSLFNVGKERVCLAYQGYGMVSLMYSPQGARKLVELARETGIYTPVDCWIFEQAHMDRVKGYAPKPDYANIVVYDWSAASHVQQTERL